MGAFALDLYRARYPRRRYGVASVVDYVAYVIHNPVRLEEATFERAKDVDRQRNVIRLIGTKTPASEERWAPIQAAYEPWLEKALRHCESPEDFLLPGAPGQLANVSTVSGAFATVLVACDRKRAGERTQIFRGTNMSMALAAGISADQIAVFAGHEIVGDPLMSSHYLRWQAFVAGLPARAWNYVPDLGTPDEIEALVREALRAGRSGSTAEREPQTVMERICAPHRARVFQTAPAPASTLSTWRWPGARSSPRRPPAPGGAPVMAARHWTLVALRGDPDLRSEAWSAAGESKAKQEKLTEALADAELVALSRSGQVRTVRIEIITARYDQDDLKHKFARLDPRTEVFAPSRATARRARAAGWPRPVHILDGRRYGAPERDW